MGTAAPVVEQNLGLGADTSYFQDGKRRIDAILVYVMDVDESLVKQLWRDTFRTNLMVDKGLETELAFSTNPWTKLCFLKIHVPYKRLKEHGEALDIKPSTDEYSRHFQQNLWWYRLFPLNVPDVESCDEYLHNIYKEDFNNGLLSEDEDLYTTGDRALIVWEIMWRTRYGPEPQQIGILRLLQEQIFVTTYPLHDGDIASEMNVLATHREVLYREWGCLQAMFKHQPLNVVCIYFGNEVVLYYAWLAFYNRMLIIPTIIGVITFIYGIATIHGSNSFVAELCASEDWMCAECSDYKYCSAYELANSCSHAKVAYINDNYMTIVFAIVMAFWATTFTECWKRKLALLNWYWNLHDTTTDDDVRPQYEAAAVNTHFNSLTNKYYYHTGFLDELFRIGLSVCVFILLTIFTCLLNFGAIILKSLLIDKMRRSENQFWRQNSSLVAGHIVGILTLMVVMTLEHIYGKLAMMMTNWENPRTRATYDKSYALKIYIFSFVNYYSGLIYIAFFKGKFYTYPGDASIWRSGLILELCDPAGCLSELSVQLAIIMFWRLVIYNTKQILTPYVLRWWNERKNIRDFHELPRWEQDYMLYENGHYTLYKEIHEMVLQYGFVTLFVSTFPLAPLFALINNIFEVRIDAHKMLCHLRRPFPRRVTSLGAWEDIIIGLTYLGVIFNGIILGFTSDFVPKLVYKTEHGSLKGYVNDSLSIFETTDYDKRTRQGRCLYPGYRYPPQHPQAYEHTSRYWFMLSCRFMFVMAFEHVVFGLTVLLAYAIPDVPRNVKEKLLDDKDILLSVRS